MNYAGIRPDLHLVRRGPQSCEAGISTCRAAALPITDELHLQNFKPDYVVVLPWNLKAEVIRQLEYIKSWGGRFVTAIPCLEITT